MLAEVRFEIKTNRETWLERVEVREASSGEPIDLSTAFIRLEVAAQPHGSPMLRADSETGPITGTADGFIEWKFPANIMRTLPPGLYRVGLVYTLDEDTTQALVGDILIKDGIVS